nr:hypothetical protein SHINE37_50013 [Rhizobiaceae bacterium]
MPHPCGVRKGSGAAAGRGFPSPRSPRPCSRRLARRVSICCADVWTGKEGSGRWRGRVGMKREKIRELKEKVNCGALLERAGFAVDVKESTRRAVKFRRGGEIVIVTHEGKGWFDPLSDDKGDIFALVQRLDHVGFVEGVESVASLVGFQTSDPVWEKALPARPAATSLADRWSARCVPWRGSATWRYLSGARFLPASVLRMAITNNQLREGPYGSMWAAHTDHAGIVCGWEERGPEWRGFSTGGSKTLFPSWRAGCLAPVCHGGGDRRHEPRRLRKPPPRWLAISSAPAGDGPPLPMRPCGSWRRVLGVTLVAATGTPMIRARPLPSACASSPTRPVAPGGGCGRWQTTGTRRFRKRQRWKRRRGRNGKRGGMSGCRPPASREASARRSGPLTRPVAMPAVEEGSKGLKKKGWVEKASPRFGPTTPKEPHMTYRTCNPQGFSKALPTATRCIACSTAMPGASTAALMTQQCSMPGNGSRSARPSTTICSLWSRPSGSVARCSRSGNSSPDR